MLNQFFARVPQSKEVVLHWYMIAKLADWSNFNQLKKVFPATDYVGNGLYVFNIGGNKYRLIARIFFEKRLMYLRFIGTHAEYDRIDLNNL